VIGFSFLPLERRNESESSDLRVTDRSNKDDLGVMDKRDDLRVIDKRAT